MIDMHLRPLPDPVERKRRRWRGAQDHSDREWKRFRDSRCEDLRAGLKTPRDQSMNQGASR